MSFGGDGLLCCALEMSSPIFNFPPESYSAVYTGDVTSVNVSMFVLEWRVANVIDTRHACARRQGHDGVQLHRSAFNSI